MNVYKELREATEPQVVIQMTRYLRRLIVEEPYIRARLENPGGSIVVRPTSNPDQISYNPNIGNDAHLDLITADMVLERDFSKGERDTIKDWALGMTSQQAADYNHVKDGAIRKRRERVFDKLEQRLLDERSFELGGSGNGIVEGSLEEGRALPAAPWHPRRAEAETSVEEGNQSRGNDGEDAAR